MKLLVRRNGQGDWIEPPVRGHQNEADLQKLLATSPDLVPGDENGLPMAVAREFQVSTGRIDLIGVNVEGDITICECKLDKNPGAARAVVGQILEYAGVLRGMSFEDFAQRFRDRSGEPLSAMVFAINGENFDEEPFVARVAQNLAAGRFRLVVAVDRITEQLKQTLLYLNEHADMPVLALEASYSKAGDVEILVPSIFGGEVSSPARRNGRKPIAHADTVIVAAKVAYPEYLATSVYVCQVGRSFRDETRYMGFYKDKAIQPEVARILHRRKVVRFSAVEAERLLASGGDYDAEIGRAITALRSRAGDGPSRPEGAECQVFVLSAPTDETETLLLPEPVRHGAPNAWTQGQRYTDSNVLRQGPETTEKLQSLGG
jgi:endonuclease NucS-like protein